MREFSIEENLKKKIKKISKKDRSMYKFIMKKFEEILTCDNIDHYKNLKRPLQDFKRVHVRSSFVLTFKYIRSNDKIVFYELDHHDNIYN